MILRNGTRCGDVGCGYWGGGVVEGQHLKKGEGRRGEGLTGLNKQTEGRGRY